MTDQSDQPDKYNELLEWLYDQTPDYQKYGNSSFNPGQNNIIKLCEILGNPQKNYKTIHIAGTNGKGSTSNMIASVLKESGYRTGLYTSPHLKNFTERIRINGEEITKNFVINFIENIRSEIEKIHPSFFELTTAMAFQYFNDNEVDFAIIEVGLGGRLDATNIINPEVCGITSIGLDHQDILGESLEEIAQEKAGIIKSSIPVVIGEEKDKIKELLIQKAKEKEAPFVDATIIKHNYTTDLQGFYQRRNIKTALGILKILQEKGNNIKDEDIRKGLMNVQENNHFMGRWQTIQEKPLIIVDTGHNEEGFEMIAEQLKEIRKGNKGQLHMILGFVRGKNIERILQLLPKDAYYYFVKPPIKRGVLPKEYQIIIENNQLNYKIYDQVKNIYKELQNGLTQEDIIFVGGSNFIVSEIF